MWGSGRGLQGIRAKENCLQYWPLAPLKFLEEFFFSRIFIKFLGQLIFSLLHHFWPSANFFGPILFQKYLLIFFARRWNSWSANIKIIRKINNLPNLMDWKIPWWWRHNRKCDVVTLPWFFEPKSIFKLEVEQAQFFRAQAELKLLVSSPILSKLRLSLLRARAFS